MIGYCPNCNTRIFEIRHGKVSRPLGNYRSIVFLRENGTKIESPFCMNCHDSLNDDDIGTFIINLKNYLKSCCPSQWDENEKEDYINQFEENKIVSIHEKKGSLKQKDLENGVKVWM